MNSKNQQLLVAVIVALVIGIPAFIYRECRIDVPNMYMAILTHKIGKDLPSGAVLAPSPEYKGVQTEVLAEGRYYYNPYRSQDDLCRFGNLVDRS
jgi:hypothetical protein